MITGFIRRYYWKKMRKLKTIRNKNEIVSQEVRSHLISQIKTTRKKLRMTQLDLSKETGFSPSYLSKLEKGHRRMSLELAIKLCRTLDINLDEIIKSKD